MKIINILIILLSFNTQAGLNDEGRAIIEEIQKSISKEYGLKDKFKVVEETKFIKNSTGASRVEQQLAKQRALLQKQQGLSATKQLSGAEKVKMMLKQRRDNLGANLAREKKSNDWMSDKKNSVDNWQSQKKAQIDAWQEKKKAIINKWLRDRARYKKDIPKYKKSIAPIPKPPKVTFKKVVTKKEIKLPVFNEMHILPGAFAMKVKDQGPRPTCAAFAGVRAMEVVLAGQGKNVSLSEQYFYWASKPNCQDSRCSKRGSWPYNGFQASKQASGFDIPKESECRYVRSQMNGNETQVPLSSRCRDGYAKVDSFYNVSNLSDVITALNNNHPVVGGFKLNESFYRNNGYVFANDKKFRNAKLDSHAAGHAILFVGHMKLPKELHASEGRVCLITANSWGIGWGKGGHACISENWFLKYRFDMPFLALSKMRSR